MEVRWTINAHIESSNSSSRITRGQFDLHMEMAKQVWAFGLETSTYFQNEWQISVTFREYEKTQKAFFTFVLVSCTCVFVKVELNLIATIEVLDVVKSPGGHVVSSEWYRHGPFWGSCHCYRDHKHYAQEQSPLLGRSHFSLKKQNKKAPKFRFKTRKAWNFQMIMGLENVKALPLQHREGVRETGSSCDEEMGRRGGSFNRGMISSTLHNWWGAVCK